MIRAVLPHFVQADLEGRLPDWLDVGWWQDAADLVALAPLAQIGWFDMFGKGPPLEAIANARELEWLNTSFAGVDWLPLAELKARKVALTNGSGLAANQVAEFAVLSMLNVARGYRQMVRAQDRHEWLVEPPARRELAGSRALILGYGEIGKAIGRMLTGFGVDFTPVRSRRVDGALGPDDWRGQLSNFDWVILSLPSTADTTQMIGAAELAAMKEDAVVLNFGRAETIDQDALVDALRDNRIGSAVLDLTIPEPLPPGHALWSLENAHITMHLSGIPTPASRRRAADRFLANCEAFRTGQPLEAQVDLVRGY